MATKLIVDTDVASYVFKWHPVFAPRDAELLREFELALSFMSVAEMRQGALDANWGMRQRNLLEAYIGDFITVQSDDPLCTMWAEVRSESRRKGHPIGSADAWIAATALLLSVPLVTNNPRITVILTNFKLFQQLQIKRMESCTVRSLIQRIFPTRNSYR